MNGNDNRNRTSQYNTYTSQTQTNVNMRATQSTQTQTGTYKKGKKRFKPTKEGMVALAELFIIVLVVFLVIFLVIKGIAGRGDKPAETTTTTTASEAPPEVPKWNSGYMPSVTVASDSVHEGNLVLVNNGNEYTFPTKMLTQLTDIYGKTGGNYGKGVNASSLNRYVLPILSDMCEAMIAANQETLGSYEKYSSSDYDHILISSSYRDKIYQQDLYNKAMQGAVDPDKVYVAAPGFSEHHTGLAIDIKIYTSDAKTVDLRANEYAWLTSNCSKYGFIQRYTDEKFDLTGISGEEWHYRFVDAPHAQAISSLSICLEEYIDMLRSHTYGAEPPYEISTEKADFYVYYIPADTISGSTFISVPQGAKKVDVFASLDSITSGMYTVSGNNIDGFIVTVAK